MLKYAQYIKHINRVPLIFPQNREIFAGQLMKKLGEIIYAAITERGISIAELSRRCKCHRNTVYNLIYQQGYDSGFITIIKIADTLNLDINELAKAHKYDLD